MSSAIEQREANRQPGAGLMGEGTSPVKMIRFREASLTGSGIGTAESKACA